MKEKTFATFFSAYQDFHFWKDPGQIPYRVKKYGYKSLIIIKGLGESYTISQQYLDIQIIKRRRLFFKDIGLILFFFQNAKKIDVLNVFHIGFESSLVSFIYKTINPKGFVYLKMDNCHNSGTYDWETIFKSNLEASPHFEGGKVGIKHRIKRFLMKYLFIKRVDLFSVEDEESNSFYSENYDFLKNKIFVSYNGHTIDLISKNTSPVCFTAKENLIITVGRLGSFPKNTLALLEGFAATANKHNWYMKLAGPVAPDFVKEKEKFFKTHSQLADRITFLGLLDKTQLFDLYRKAKIFVLPSNFEGFANVYAEAMYYGNAIITTSFTSVKTILNQENLGVLVSPDNPAEIGEAILQLIENPNRLEEISSNAVQFSKKHLSWDDIVFELCKEIENRSIMRG